MADVDALRLHAERIGSYSWYGGASLIRAAANEIERLRAENGRLRAVAEGRATGNHLAVLREHEGEAG